MNCMLYLLINVYSDLVDLVLDWTNNTHVTAVFLYGFLAFLATLDSEQTKITNVRSCGFVVATVRSFSRNSNYNCTWSQDN